MPVATGRWVQGLVLAAAIGSLPLAADASVVSYYLDQSNTTPPFPDGTNYLQVMVSDGADAAGTLINGYTTTADDVLFSVSVLGTLTQYQDSGFGIDEFAFNTVLTPPPNNSNFILPMDWRLQGLGNADGFGKFELHADTNGANGRLSTLVFAITNVAGDTAASYYELASGNAGQGAYAYASHVAGMSAPSTTTSAWFAGSSIVPVPLPAALYLLISGLGYLGGAFHRKQS